MVHEALRCFKPVKDLRPSGNQAAQEYENHFALRQSRIFPEEVKTAHSSQKQDEKKGSNCDSAVHGSSGLGCGD